MMNEGNLSRFNSHLVKPDLYTSRCVWAEHIEELYDRSNKPKGIFIDDNEVIEKCRDPPIVERETEEAREEWKNEKATRPEDIPTEFLKKYRSKKGS